MEKEFIQETQHTVTLNITAGQIDSYRELEKTTGTVRVYENGCIGVAGCLGEADEEALTAQAKASPRLRMNLDLRNSAADQSQRMLNAIEPGTVLPIHRHRTTSETVVCLRGHFVEYFYDDEGRMTEAIDMVPGGTFINIPAGQWHNLVSMESGTVLLEVKDGPYAPIGPEDVLEK